MAGHFQTPTCSVSKTAWSTTLHRCLREQLVSRYGKNESHSWYISVWQPVGCLTCSLDTLDILHNYPCKIQYSFWEIISIIRSATLGNNLSERFSVEEEKQSLKLSHSERGGKPSFSWAYLLFKPLTGFDSAVTHQGGDNNKNRLITPDKIWRWYTWI